jgi:hypothetical protein
LRAGVDAARGRARCRSRLDPGIADRRRFAGDRGAGDDLQDEAAAIDLDRRRRRRRHSVGRRIFDAFFDARDLLRLLV